MQSIVSIQLQCNYTFRIPVRWLPNIIIIIIIIIITSPFITCTITPTKPHTHTYCKYYYYYHAQMIKLSQYETNSLLSFTGVMDVSLSDDSMSSVSSDFWGVHSPDRFCGDTCMDSPRGGVGGASLFKLTTLEESIRKTSVLCFMNWVRGGRVEKRKSMCGKKQREREGGREGKGRREEGGRRERERCAYSCRHVLYNFTLLIGPYCCLNLLFHVTPVWSCSCYEKNTTLACTVLYIHIVLYWVMGTCIYHYMYIKQSKQCHLVHVAYWRGNLLAANNLACNNRL